MAVSKGLKTKIAEDAVKYYGEKLNIVQVYPDPKVSQTYVVRVEEEDGKRGIGACSSNWCFVVNYGYGDDIDDAMIEDGIELEPGQKISKKDFGDLRFF